MISKISARFSNKQKFSYLAQKLPLRMKKQSKLATLLLFLNQHFIKALYNQQINENMQSQVLNQKIYHHIDGTVCLIGYGSIGKGITPLIKRHFTYDRFVVLDPLEVPKEGVCDKFYQLWLVKENYVNVLDEIFEGKKGFLVNLSVGVCSKQLTEYCQSKEIFYIDTVKEVWKGFFSDPNYSLSVRSNYGIRHTFKEYFKNKNYKTTAVSCCGANPGMVSWFVKKALIDIARDTNYELQAQPKTREEWALLMKNLGVKGIHVAERDTQKTNLQRPIGHFWNTWSIEGLLSEGFEQVAEIGWGTHEKWMPHNARKHQFGTQSAIYILRPGIYTLIKSWCPTPGPQVAMMVTHDESISIPEYYTVKEIGEVVYRPTANYAYQPSEVTMNSCADMYGTGEIPPKDKWKILTQAEITEGIDQLGVLLYGHSKNAYWYGSRLSTQDTRKIAPNQNSTGLQVSSAVLAAMVWTIENPNEGLVEANEMDYKRCLQVQRPYIEPLMGVYTDWNPLTNTSHSFTEDFDHQDPWQFKNILLHR